MLVLIICRATRSSDASLFQSMTFNEKKNLPIDQKILLKVRRIFFHFYYSIQFNIY